MFANCNQVLRIVKSITPKLARTISRTRGSLFRTCAPKPDAVTPVPSPPKSAAVSPWRGRPPFLRGHPTEKLRPCRRCRRRRRRVVLFFSLHLIRTRHGRLQAPSAPPRGAAGPRPPPRARPRRQLPLGLLLSSSLPALGLLFQNGNHAAARRIALHDLTSDMLYCSERISRCSIYSNHCSSLR
jgi:hypothetical protein